MKVLILFEGESPQEREAVMLAKRLEELGVTSELVSADTAEGSTTRELYDVLASPAVVVVRDDGTLVQSWQHGWPLAEDISYCYHA